MQRLTLTILAALALINVCDFSAAQTPRSIELTLLSDSKTGGRDHQKWLAMLSDVGADRIRIASAVRPRPSIKENVIGNTNLVSISGTISGNRIKFPGKSFARSDTDGIRNFLQQLRSDGIQTTLAPKEAFGLTSAQLATVHGELSVVRNFSGTEATSRSIVESLLDAVPLAHQFSASALDELSDSPMSADLNGLSAGTALAVALRQDDLAFCPTPKSGSRTYLKILTSDQAEESWPPGWPVEAAPVNAFPKLFQMIPLQVNRTPLTRVLAAIERRLDLPFVIDPAAPKDRSGNRVDLSKTLVSYNKKKTSYSLALSKLLLQAKPRLRHEIRADENGTKFLWITRQ